MNTTTKQTKNEEILKTREAEYNKRKGPRVGDYLLMPYGLYTRFTHKWDETIQTGGGSGSYYLGGSYISYSGGLDSGVKLSDIEDTGETKPGHVWFFDQGISGANRGVDFMIDFRVFKLKEGADLSGLPQIKRHEKKLLQAQAETITRINGNGQEYTLPLPELYINEQFLNDYFFQNVEKQTGLKFTKSAWGYVAQPMKHSQITTLFAMYNFESTYYNNSTHENMYFLKMKH